MSSASYASFTGLAILEFPRKITTKGLVFDASFYLGLPERQSVLASLRLFNQNDEVFSDIGLYFVYTTVIIPSTLRLLLLLTLILVLKIAQMDPSIEVFTGEGSGSPYTPDEFSLVGDIQFLFYLGVPSEAGIDYRKPPYIHICGPAFDVNIPAATFSVTAEQYTGAFRDVQKAAAQNGQRVAKSLSLSTICTIQDSARYENNKKPVPYNKRFVMVAGNITGMTSVLENDKIKDSYRVDVGNVVFLGTYVAPATPATNSAAASSSTSTPASGKRAKRWSYDTPVGGLKRKNPDADDGRSSGPPSSPSPLA
ncbi:hypothetical protein MVEN_02307600 [Mycena venus]|uniref:Uncharacterized protein n=1 Tax=Mycena venus TaxID=2733690 RepID=A0A8H6X4T5_9AGAR|nr:hypothetical protein MVEN_02307600 [Mycena venus]